MLLTAKSIFVLSVMVFLSSCDAGSTKSPTASQKSCKINADCPGGYCTNNVCQSGAIMQQAHDGDPCQATSECGPSSTCKNNLCKAQSLEGGACEEDSDCQMIKCIGSVCRKLTGTTFGAACQKSSDCIILARCLNLKCETKLGRDKPCASADDCWPGLKCEQNLCRPSTGSSDGQSCTDTSDCQVLSVCKNSVCQSQGTVGAPCKDGTDCWQGLSCQNSVCDARLDTR